MGTSSRIENARLLNIDSRNKSSVSLFNPDGEARQEVGSQYQSSRQLDQAQHSKQSGSEGSNS